jgi:repressor of nif and glnA expression
MTNIQTQRKLIEILRIINESDDAIGARTIAANLSKRGYPIGERAVRYYLTLLDYKGFTTKLGYSGRIITEKGLTELNEAIVGDRVGFVISKIEDFVYQTTLDSKQKSGDIIINVTTIKKDDFETAVEIAGRVIDEGYTVSPYIRIVEEGDRAGAILIPYGSVGIITMCSMTIDGILVKHGIPTDIMYGGILKVESKAPFAYTDVISYKGTSLDPIQIFTSRRMTAIMDAVDKGTGAVLSNLRTVPSIAYEQVKDVLHEARRVGITGWIENFGMDDSFNISLEDGMVGINIYAGVNSMAALNELAIDANVKSISSLMDVRLLKQRL